MAKPNSNSVSRVYEIRYFKPFFCFHGFQVSVASMSRFTDARLTFWRTLYQKKALCSFSVHLFYGKLCPTLHAYIDRRKSWPIMSNRKSWAAKCQTLLWLDRFYLNHEFKNEMGTETTFRSKNDRRIIWLKHFNALIFLHLHLQDLLGIAALSSFTVFNERLLEVLQIPKSATTSCPFWCHEPSLSFFSTFSVSHSHLIPIWKLLC